MEIMYFSIEGTSTIESYFYVQLKELEDSNFIFAFVFN